MTTIRRAGYVGYVNDAEHMTLYADYQRRYALTPRESDRVILELVGATLATLGPPATRRVLDIGCSTGNLLLHLRRRWPALELVGGDLAADVIEACRRDPALGGIRFEVMDMLELEPTADFDIVIANASLMFFDAGEFERALERLAGALRAGGRLVVFDLFHPFEQELTILEESATHPDGIRFRLRSQRTVRAALDAAGLGGVVFQPFEIPIDLETPPEFPTATRTVRLADGTRQCFRGALHQPWCHAHATKGGAS